MRIFLLIMMFLMLSGCATCFEDVKIGQAIKENKIHAGMTIDEVAAVIGRKPLMGFDKWLVEHKADGEYVTWVVNGGGMGGNLAGTYALIFKDHKLIEWDYRQ